MRTTRALVLATLFAIPAVAVPRALAAQVAGDVGRSPSPPDSTLRSAERAAREWLWLLDEQSYERAWTLVAPAMKSLVGYEQWATSLASLRSVLPRVLRRELLRAEPSVALFGGNSVILSFGVGSGTLREILVLVRASAGWQVGGYGILLY